MNFFLSKLAILSFFCLSSCVVEAKESEVDERSDASSSVHVSSSTEVINDGLVSCWLGNDEGNKSSCYELSKAVYLNWPRDYDFCDEYNHFEENGCSQDFGKKCEGIVEDGIPRDIYFYGEKVLEQIEAMGGCEGLQRLNDLHGEDN